VVAAAADDDTQAHARCTHAQPHHKWSLFTLRLSFP